MFNEYKLNGLLTITTSDRNQDATFDRRISKYSRVWILQSLFISEIRGRSWNKLLNETEAIKLHEFVPVSSFPCFCSFHHPWIRWFLEQTLQLDR